MIPLERAVVVATKWTLWGLIVSVPLLLLDVNGPASDPTTPFLIHLSWLVGFGLAVTWVLLPLTAADWYSSTGWSVRRRLAFSGAGIVALSTGAVALVTLASSAALRYDPSTQFLQLLSALDIAWVGAAVMVGSYRLWGRAASIVGGLVIGIFCVWSIWNYVSFVGFGPDGEWIVSGSDMMTRVIPFDMAAATVAVIVFVAGVRRAARQVTEQPSPQS
jgi:hypothetical protein